MKRILNITASILLLAAMVACNNEAFEVVPDETPVGRTDSTAAMPMRLVGGVTPFEGDNGTTRADDWAWQNGAVLYLQFYNGSNRIHGHAVYASSTKTWTIPSWDGAIGASGKCEVYFFHGANTSSKTNVTLDCTHGVYGDRNASYIYQDGAVTVSASLQPLTSRIRFLREAGTSVSTLHVDGITTYTGYNATTNTFTTTNNTVGFTVLSSGYTPYVYANFTNESERQLSITNNVDGNGLLFKCTFGNNVLRTGHSGYITIPTEANNKGWTVTGPETRTFTVTGNGKTVTFTMKRVEAGTFQMGGSDSNAESNEKPVHTVTLTKSYYMGETEVTQALWYAVMGQKPTADGSAWSGGYGLGDNYPAYYISWNDCQQFINSLNSKFSSQLSNGEQFRFPTEAQWEYAARGGNKSKGYLYAGSDQIGDVAWYTSNSGSTTHQVKGKTANELGLYDMSGNVWEWCLDWYNSSYYSSSPTTDPVNTTSASYRVTRGGSWDFNAAYCRVANRDFNWPLGRSDDRGLRLALQ